MRDFVKQLPMHMNGVLVDSHVDDWRTGKIPMRMIGVLVRFICV